MPESIHQNNNQQQQQQQKNMDKIDKRDEEILELKQKLIDLMKENNEMKELILFLDDERNYAKQFMKQFNTKQSLNWNSLKQKLNYLEQKQFELIKENLSLKQLCVLLDENYNLDNQSNQLHQQQQQQPQPIRKTDSIKTSPSSIVCQYIIKLENELKSFYDNDNNNNNNGNSNCLSSSNKQKPTILQRPKLIHDILKLYSLYNSNDYQNTATMMMMNNDRMSSSTSSSSSSSSSTATPTSSISSINNNQMATNEEKSIIYSLSETAIKSIVFNNNNNNTSNTNNINNIQMQ